MTKRMKTTKSRPKSKKSKAVHIPKMQSFKLSHDPPFLTMKVTTQTLYWSVLMVVVSVSELWVLSAQLSLIDTATSIAAF
jgi:hypothetical protein